MWILLTQISAILDATKSVILKSTPKEINSIVATWLWMFFTTLTVLPFTLVAGIPETTPVFWRIMALRLALDPLAIYFFTKSLRMEDISLVLPLLSFTPVVILFVSIFVNGEVPSVIGLLGVLTILVGIYLLNLKPGMKWLDPFMNITAPASRYMLAAALLWGFEVPFFKIAIANASTSLFTLVGSLGIFLVFSIVVLTGFRKQALLALQPENLKKFATIGLADGLMVQAKTFVLKLAFVGYISAMNKLSILYATIFGMLFFKEKIGRRLVPLGLILIGFWILILG